MKTFNSLIVRVKETHDDKVLIKDESGKDIELEIPLGYSAGNIDEKTSLNNKYTRVKISGEVVSKPELVKNPKNSPVYEVYRGQVPPYAPYRNSEEIEARLAFYNDYQRRMYKHHDALKYQCGSYEPEYVDITEQEIDVRVGDTVYFSYLGYDPQNFIKKEDGYEYYYIRFESVYCVVRDGEIAMVNGNVFIRPYYGDDFEEIDVDGSKIWGKFLGNTDIVETVKETPKYLEGIVYHIGNPLGYNTRETVAVGDRVVFTAANVVRETDIKDKVEGEEYFTMKQWDIMAKVLDKGYRIDLSAFKEDVDPMECIDEFVETNEVKDEWFKPSYNNPYAKLEISLQPVGDYLLVKPTGTLLNEKRVLHKAGDTSQVEEGKIVLLEDTVKKEESTEGKVLACGELCNNITQGDNIKYYGGTYLNEYDQILVRESDVLGVYVS